MQRVAKPSTDAQFFEKASDVEFLKSCGGKLARVHGVFVTIIVFATANFESGVSVTVRLGAPESEPQEIASEPAYRILEARFTPDAVAHLKP